MDTVSVYVLFVYRMMDDDSSLMMVTQLMMAPERTPGIIMGPVILRKVVISEAPREMAASSMLGLIFPKMAVEERTV